MNIRRLLLSVAIIAILFSGCEGKSANTASGSLAVSETKTVFKPRHREADHKVVALVGPEFAAKPEVLDGLIEEYGLDGAGGMVVKLQYPDSLLDGKRVKLSLLASAIEAPGVTTFVSVGAPEGVITEIMKVKGRNPGLRVINLFSADDMTSVESVSDISLECAPPAELLADENAAVLPQEGVDVLVLASVLAAEDRDTAVSPLVRFQTSLDTARSYLKKKSVGADWSVAAWVDPDTNLRSRIRLVLSSSTSAPLTSAISSDSAGGV